MALPGHRADAHDSHKQALNPQKAAEGHQRSSPASACGVRLSADELAALRAMAERERLTLPAALRLAFMRQVQADHH